METNQQLTRMDNAPPAPVEPNTVLQIINLAAKDSNVDVDKMERLMAMHERILAREAEMAFNRAMKEVQSKIPVVPKDARNTQIGSKYTRLETMHRIIVPIISEGGFSLSFGTADCPIPEHRRVTCHVSHVGGHSRDYQADLPIDTLGPQGKPNKSLMHGCGSTMSYGRRYLTMLIFNVPTGDDDDGNAFGQREGPEVIVGLKAMLWSLLKKHEKVPAGGTWKHGYQWFVDEALLSDTETLEALDSSGWRRLLAATQKKLEGK